MLTQPKTLPKAEEFLTNLQEVKESVVNASTVPEDEERVNGKLKALETTIAIWEDFSNPEFQEPEETLNDAYLAFALAIFRGQSITSNGEREGYVLALDCLHRAGFTVRSS